MKVSVVIATHSMARYAVFRKVVESVLSQTYDRVEAVIVVDGTEAVYDRARNEFGDRDDVLVHQLPENRGVSVARTTGAKLASGDVVAFIDDDAVAAPDWIERLVAVYERRDAVAVGGRMTGSWNGGRPWYLPAEFDWLVGVTYPGFAEPGEVVRNTFESNISVRRDVFLELGGYDPELGPTTDEYSHSEGAEFGLRLREAYDTGVVYEPNAVVEHIVFEHRTRPLWLARRAFAQGRSKRLLERRADGRSSAGQTSNPNGEGDAERTSSTDRVGSTDGENGMCSTDRAHTAATERAYLRHLLLTRVPMRLRDLAQSPAFAAVGQLLALFVLIAIVGLGYLWAALIEIESALGVTDLR